MTQNTEQLIDSLARSATPVRSMPSPLRLMLRLGSVLLAYSVVIGLVLGLRADIAMQIQRPFYLAEILLLALVTVSSVLSAVYLAFPDQYQHPLAARLPFYSTGFFIVLLLVQLFLPADARMVIPQGEGVHGMECTVCIAVVSIIPSALMLLLLRKGVSAYPPLSGACCVLAAAAIGCLMLRLHEQNDSLAHLVLWHYIPTLLFAVLGAFIGKSFFKW